MDLFLQSAVGIMGKRACVKLVPAGDQINTEFYLNGTLDAQLSSVKIL
jgi:hypothetical protein